MERLWRACAASGDLYRTDYEGLYCVGCEQFCKPAELLLSAGEQLPTDIAVHDYLTAGGRKISKSGADDGGEPTDPVELPRRSVLPAASCPPRTRCSRGSSPRRSGRLALTSALIRYPEVVARCRPYLNRSVTSGT